MKRNAELENRVAQLYDERLQYHNFGHVLRVLDAAEQLLVQCRSEGVAVDEEVVYYAILLHDAGFYEDHAARGFDSKEAYSAHLAGELLRELGVAQDVTDRVQAAILATHIDARCHSNEDKLVRLADLHGLGGDYARFKQDTLDLKQEAEMMAGRRIDWEEWKAMADQRIILYLREDMALVSGYYDGQGQSVFHTRALDNISTLKDDEGSP